jgi:hypothetical protein
MRSILLYFCLFCGLVSGWIGHHDPQRQKWILLSQQQQYADEIRRAVSITVISAAIMFQSLTINPTYAFGSSAVDPNASFLQEKLIKSLSQPTEDRPQIPFPVSSSNLNQENIEVVQGLIYLQDPKQERPLATDIMTIKLFAAEDPERPVAGAKIPISRVRFPMKFRMTKDNVLPGQEQTWDKAQDFLVKTTICRQQEDGEASCAWNGEGLSKYIQLPASPALGSSEGGNSGIGIRAAASISLSKQ